MDPYKYSFPNVIAGGGGGVPPATATKMWATGVRAAFDQAEAARKRIVSNSATIDSLLAKVSASVAAAEQAKLAAESAGSAAFARDMGFSMAASSAGISDARNAGVALSILGAVTQRVGSFPLVLASRSSTHGDNIKDRVLTKDARVNDIDKKKGEEKTFASKKDPTKVEEFL